jgi:hypothetical protein
MDPNKPELEYWHDTIHRRLIKFTCPDGDISKKGKGDLNLIEKRPLIQKKEHMDSGPERFSVLNRRGTCSDSLENVLTEPGEPFESQMNRNQENIELKTFLSNSRNFVNQSTISNRFLKGKNEFRRKIMNIQKFLHKTGHRDSKIGQPMSFESNRIFNRKNSAKTCMNGGTIPAFDLGHFSESPDAGKADHDGKNLDAKGCKRRISENGLAHARAISEDPRAKANGTNLYNTIQTSPIYQTIDNIEQTAKAIKSYL